MRAEGCDVCGWIVVEQNEDIIEEEAADSVLVQHIPLQSTRIICAAD